jgi:RNA polymerase sigma factor (sigma-70 family)
MAGLVIGGGMLVPILRTQCRLPRGPLRPSAATADAEIEEPGGASGKVLHVEADDDADAVAASLTRPDCFGVLFNRYHGAIWAFLARAAGHDAADELAGDVFVAAFTNRHRYDPSCGTVRAWLYGIAMNLQRTRWRSDARQARALERVAGGLVGAVTPIDTADEMLDGRHQLDQVRHAMACLPERHREVLTLFVWERLSYEEIASALGVEVGTVRSRLARARSELRSLVDCRGGARG